MAARLSLTGAPRVGAGSTAQLWMWIAQHVLQFDSTPLVDETAPKGEPGEEGSRRYVDNRRRSVSLELSP